MLKHEDEKRWKVQFDSLPELSSWLDNTPATWRGHASRDSLGGKSWDLGASYPKAKELAATGWEAGVRNLFALATAVPNTTVTTRELSVAGDYPDVPRYLAGDPYNMVHRGKQRTPKPAMTIAVNCRISAAVGAQEQANFGAAIVALVDRLEARGVRVELLGLLATNVTRRRVCISWTVKAMEDSLDLSAVAFSYAHPCMFRRLGFAVMERMPRVNEHAYYGMEGGIKRSDFIDLPEGALLIPGVDHNPGACSTMERALAFAKTQINLAAGSDIVELEDLD